MKNACKAILRSLSVLVILPVLVCFCLHRLVADRDAAVTSWSQLMSLIPGKLGVYLRNAFYRTALKSCDVNASIGFGTLFSHGGASVGRTAYIGNYCSIGDVAIGDDVLIASHVSIMNGCHQHGIESLEVPIREQLGTYKPVTIGEDSWIGEKATVAANVGRHCVVGAGALVLKDLPDYAIAVGVPAQVVGDRRELKKAPRNEGVALNARSPASDLD